MYVTAADASRPSAWQRPRGTFHFFFSGIPACGPIVDSDRKTAMLDCTDSPWFVGSLIPDFRHKVELCWSIQGSAENSLHAQPQRSRVAQHEPLSA